MVNPAKASSTPSTSVSRDSTSASQRGALPGGKSVQTLTLVDLSNLADAINKLPVPRPNQPTINLGDHQFKLENLNALDTEGAKPHEAISMLFL